MLKDNTAQNIASGQVPYWLIVSVKNDAVQYLGRDEGSGGYPYWASDVDRAHRYELEPLPNLVLNNGLLSDGGRELRLLKIVPTIGEMHDITDYLAFSKMRKDQLEKAHEDRVLEQAAEILKRRKSGATQ